MTDVINTRYLVLELPPVSYKGALKVMNTQRHLETPFLTLSGDCAISCNVENQTQAGATIGISQKEMLDLLRKRLASKNKPTVYVTVQVGKYISPEHIEAREVSFTIYAA